MQPATKRIGAILQFPGPASGCYSDQMPIQIPLKICTNLSTN